MIKKRTPFLVIGGGAGGASAAVRVGALTGGCVVEAWVEMLETAVLGRKEDTEELRVYIEGTGGLRLFMVATCFFLVQIRKV